MLISVSIDNKMLTILYHILVQVVRCCLENAASVAKTFLTADAVVVDIREPQPLPRKPILTTPGTSSFVPYTEIRASKSRHRR